MDFEGKETFHRLETKPLQRNPFPIASSKALLKGQFFRGKPYFMESETYFLHILSPKYRIRTKVTMGGGL